MFEIFQIASLVANAGVTQNITIGDIGNSASTYNDAATNANPTTQLQGQPSTGSNWIIYAVIGVIIYGFIFKK